MKFTQISIRSLIAATTLIAIAIAAIVQGGVASSIYVAVSCIGVTLVAITALVAAGLPRAMAVGCVVPIALYFGALASIGASEFSGLAKLPTSRISNRLYDSISRPIYTDMMTGKTVPNYDPSKKPTVSGMGGGGFGGGGMAGAALTAITPDRDEFLLTCHVGWATLLGLAGGIYGRFLYLTQNPASDG